jgi:hypothetical protein
VVSIFKLDSAPTMSPVRYEAQPARAPRNITPGPAQLSKPRSPAKPVMASISSSKADDKDNWEQF